MNRRQFVSFLSASPLFFIWNWKKEKFEETDFETDFPKLNKWLELKNSKPEHQEENLLRTPASFVDEHGTRFKAEFLARTKASHDLFFVAYPYIEQYDGEKYNEYNYRPLYVRLEYTDYYVHLVGVENINDDIRYQFQDFVSQFYQLEEDGKLEREDQSRT